MPQRDREHPDKGLKALSQDRPFHVHAADGIGAIEHDHVAILARGRHHAERHRPDVRVDARPDILQVENQDIHLGQHLRCGRARRPIEAEEGRRWR